MLAWTTVVTSLMIASSFGDRRGAGAAAANGCVVTWAWSHSLLSMIPIDARRESNPLTCCLIILISDEGSDGYRAATVGVGGRSAGFDCRGSRRCRSSSYLKLGHEFLEDVIRVDFPRGHVFAVWGSGVDRLARDVKVDLVPRMHDYRTCRLLSV